MFDTCLMIDWSGGNDRGANPKPDAIWVGTARRDGTDCGPPQYFRNRSVLERWLTAKLDAELRAGRKTCCGFDFPFGYPAGFARALTGTDNPFAVWAYLADRIKDAPKTNNRFDVAGTINAAFHGAGPFWGNGLTRDIAHLPRKGRKRTGDHFAEHRATETATKGTFSCWQLSGAGAVGSQVLMGMPVLHRLRQRFAGRLAVWPFDTCDKPIALVEIWPSFWRAGIAASGRDHWIKDAAQVQFVAAHLAGLSSNDMATLLNASAPEEGWILGVPQARA